LLEIHLSLADLLSESDWTLIKRVAFEKTSHLSEESKARKFGKCLRLHKAQHNDFQFERQAAG
jgi:hypothetical protein